MGYRLNPDVMNAVWQLKYDGMNDAVPVYCGAALAYSAIMQPTPDWAYFKKELYHALDAGQRRGYHYEDIVNTFCGLCFVEPQLALAMIT